MGWTVEHQADAHALSLWNAVSDGHNAHLRELTDILRRDFPTFCALALKVRPKGGGRTTPFLFNQVQRRMWREIVRRIESGMAPWFVILKFRQAGMSTFWCAWLFWQMWRQTDIQTMVIAHQLLTAETMIETQKVFFDELPEIFKPQLREGNHGASIPRGEIYFADRRCWEMIHLSKNVDPRGQQVTHVLETEHAMYHDPDTLNGALLPQLPQFGSEEWLQSSVVIESTPKGQNEFYDLYMDAKEGRVRKFGALFYPWFLFDEQYTAQLPPRFKLSPEETEERQRLSALRKEWPKEDGGGLPVTPEQMYWRRETIASDYRGNVDVFNQEYPSDDISCFLLASKSVFRDLSTELLQMCDDAKKRAAMAWSRTSVNGKTVDAIGPQRVKLLPELDRLAVFTPIERDVKFEIHPHGPWVVWEPPVDGHKYCIGGDPAMGLEDSDNSVICVIDVTEGRQVAEWVALEGPEEMAIQMAAAGYWYNQAMLVPEINSLGYTLLVRLVKNITYPNMYRWPKWDEVNTYSKKRGFETNNRTKQLMVNYMRHYLESGMLSIASRDLLSELSTFEQKREDEVYIVFGAQKNRMDDRVMAFGLAIMGIEQTPILLMEINRNQSRLPSARELHLATSLPDNPAPLPKKIEEMITVKHTIPWNPLQELVPL